MTTKAPLIDIGLNLASKRFASDWREVAGRALEAEVGHFILTGTSLADSQAVARLANALPENVGFFTAGVHPHRSAELNEAGITQLRALLKHPKAVAVGETGLDYNRNLAPKDVQRQAFERQVQLACELQKPLFLHERDAAADLLAILDAHRSDLPPCVVHCFTSGAKEARNYLDRGFYLGITGWVGQRHRNGALLEAMSLIPADRLMLETDAPYITPPGYKTPQPGRNEPAAMQVVAELVAQVRRVSVDQVRADAYAATKQFFNLPIA